MDSDIDADTPVRMKPIRKFFDPDSKSPVLPLFNINTLQTNKPVSPMSNYSTKSSKELLDVSEIRRVLGKLKMELETERKKNHDLDHNTKLLEDNIVKTERKYKEMLSRTIASSKKKLEETIRNMESVKQDELGQLQRKIDELSGKLMIKENGIDLATLLDTISTMEHLCNHTSGNSNDWRDMKNEIDRLKLSLNGQSQKETSDSKLLKLKDHNHELTKIIKMLDVKLNGAQTEIEALTKKLEIKSQQTSITNQETSDNTRHDRKFEDMLQRANVEIIQLQKQITWLKNSEDEDPATKERVEVLSNLIQSLKNSQRSLEYELSNLREKCKNVDILTDELTRLKNENQILISKSNEFCSVRQNIDKLEQSFPAEQSSESKHLFKIEKLENLNKQYFNQIQSMERLLKYIRETNEKRTELEIEYAAMKTLLETKLQHKFLKQKDQMQSGHDDNSDDSTENLKIKLREMEKRRTQQALNYEEALLELEALKKNSQRQNIDFIRRNGVKDDLGWLIELMSSYSMEKNVNNFSTTSSVMEGLLGNMDLGKVDIRESAIFGKSDGSTEDEIKYLIDLQHNGGANIGHGKEVDEIAVRTSALSLDPKFDKQRKHIAAPTQIRIDNQANSRIVRWKTPDMLLNMEGTQITSYHIYMDGDFYKAIGANELLSAVLPNLDSRSHRVSIRSVCPQGQSKDSQCTIEINSNTPAPSVLKANKITGTSAHVSWMPSNSTFRHAIWVNGVKFCDCLPGVYKILLQGLAVDSLQKIRVHPVLDQYPDSTTISAYLDFQTLPVSGEAKLNISKKQTESVIEEIEAPRDVKLKLGNRSGRFLVRWTCSQEPTSPSIKLVGYQILINNQCIALVNGAKNDRFSLNLVDLREISVPANQKLLNLSEQSYLPLTVRTMGTVTEIDKDDCTVLSKDSQPHLKFSGQVAARIAGTAAEAAMMLGDQLAYFLNLSSRTPKSSTKDHSQAKISVPKIQITKDSSFSEDDDGHQMTQYKNKHRPNSDPYKDKYQQRNDPSQYPDYAGRPDDQPVTKQQKSFQNIPNERVPINQRQINNYNNNSNNNNVNNNGNSSNTSINNNNGAIINSAPSDRYYYGNQQQNNDPIRYFIALYDYDPGTMSPNPDAINEELPFKTGQTVKIFGQVDEDGFYTGETNGRRGLVPSNMVKEIDNMKGKGKFKSVEANNEDFGDKSLKRNKDLPMSKNIQFRPAAGQYNAESHPDYPPNQYIGNQGQYQDPYSHIAHRKSTDSGVSNAASDPNSYHKPTQLPNNVPRQPSHVTGGVSLNGKKMVALYDYDPQVLSPNVDSDAELAFKANDIIIILSEIDEDGFYLGERNGQRGLVPSNFLVEAAGPPTNRLRNQQSFDTTANQNNFKERNFSASSNFSDPPPVRDNRFRGKPLDNQRDVARNNPVPGEDYLVDRGLDVDHTKNVNNSSYEESFDSGPPINRTYAPKPDTKRAPYQTNMEHRGSLNTEPNINANERDYPRNAPIANQIPVRMAKQIDDRRMVHDKISHPPPQSSIKLPPRRQSPPPSLEQDDMPIVMDLAPSKDNQKKKKLSTVPDNYRANLSETHDNYGNSDNLYANSNSSMSDNLERKRSVFKNPFKKKKS